MELRRSNQHFFFFFSYLHDNEEDEGDEDVDLRVLPGRGVSDVVELLGDAVFGPRAVVQQGHQRLSLGQLENHSNKHGSKRHK